MHFPRPRLLQALVCLISIFIGTGTLGAWSADDPLKDLVDGLRVGTPQKPEDWLSVLLEQPDGTVVTLDRVLRSEGNSDWVDRFEGQLRSVVELIGLDQTSADENIEAWTRQCNLTLEIVQVVGESEQVGFLLDVLGRGNETSESYFGGGVFQRSLRLSLLAALDRDASTLRTLQHAYGDQTRSLDAQLLRILGDCELPNTPDTLARCLGKRRSFDGIVLTQIASNLRKPHLRISEFGLGAVRPLLDSETPHTRQSAARALGYADDTASIQPLIELLRDSSDSVRNESLLALHRITAMTIDGDADRWTHWFKEESDWWREESLDVLQSLKNNTEPNLAKTMRVLAGKRLFRRELAPPVMELLSDPRPEVVRLALATLESLRPPLNAITPPLAELAHHQDPRVRRDATRILQYLVPQDATAPAGTSPSN
ncbi:MAG: HEAT repeat domain-containing protein [Planctomycetes bacterium]|nr:HEAT repeat domain-containing protein [Planctomycetota bacterium]